MSSVAIIDDNDPVVQYSDGWTLDQTYPYAMGLTRHGAPAGSDLTATVKFHGTSITVFGIISGPGADHSNYTMPAAGFVLDGGTSGVFNGYTLSSLIDTIYNQTLYSQDGLALQDHELTITRVQGNTPIILWLDYFLVGGQPLSSSSTGSGVTAAPSSRTSSTSTSSEAPDHGTSSSSSSIPTSTASSSSASSDSTAGWFSSVFASTGPASASSVTSTAFTSQTVVVVSTPSSSASRSTSTSTAPATPFATSSATHTPAIIGGSVGASLLVILVAVLACILQRRRRRIRSDDRAPAIEPYVPVPRRAPSPSRAPPNPTKSSMRPSSTAAGTIHTSAPSAAPSVPPVPPEKSEQRNDPPSRPAGPGHPRATPGSHSPSSLPMATDTPSADSFPSGTPLILPTEIGQALTYAPPEVQSNVLSLFRSLFLRSGGAPNHRRPEPGTGLHLHAEVDSGLRMYNDAYVPPPEYTTH